MLLVYTCGSLPQCPLAWSCHEYLRSSIAWAGFPILLQQESLVVPGHHCHQSSVDWWQWSLGSSLLHCSMQNMESTTAPYVAPSLLGFLVHPFSPIHSDFLWKLSLHLLCPHCSMETADVEELWEHWVKPGCVCQPAAFSVLFLWESCSNEKKQALPGVLVVWL